MTGGTFMYFAYGSNLLAKRIHINNPSAIAKGIGKLKDYRLDFNGKSELWNGAVATVIEDNRTDVWGSIWEIDTKHLESLDKQEGVASNWYKVLIKNIETPAGECISCRIYQQVAPLADSIDLRKPSITYLNIIIKGAEDFSLPDEYVKFLKSIEHNNQVAAAEIREIVGM